MLILSPRNIASMRSLQAALFGELKEQLEGLVGDAVFRVVEKEADGFRGEACSPLGILIEELAQGGLRDFGGMVLECFPRRDFEKRELVERSGCGRHGRRAPCVGNSGGQRCLAIGIIVQFGALHLDDSNVRPLSAAR